MSDKRKIVFIGMRIDTRAIYIAFGGYFLQTKQVIIEQCSGWSAEIAVYDFCFAGLTIRTFRRRNSVG